MKVQCRTYPFEGLWTKRVCEGVYGTMNKVHKTFWTVYYSTSIFWRIMYENCCFVSSYLLSYGLSVSCVFRSGLSVDYRKSIVHMVIFFLRYEIGSRMVCFNDLIDQIPIRGGTGSIRFDLKIFRFFSIRLEKNTNRSHLWHICYIALRFWNFFNDLQTLNWNELCFWKEKWCRH